MKWKDCKSAFDVDGSVRDIYVLDTTYNDWTNFLAVAPSLGVSFYRGGKLSKLPTQGADLFISSDDILCSLSINLGSLVISCTCFSVDEIELFLDPNDVNSQTELDAIIHLMNQMGEAINKDVILTDESAPWSIWFQYDACKKRIEFNRQ